MLYKSNNRVNLCPVDTCLELISGKWKPRILWKLRRDGVRWFGQLRGELETITPKMLTQQLRELERDGLVKRRVYAQVPPKVEYSLSDFGQTLGPILDQIAKWGMENNQQIVELLSEQKAA
jgi:DNA-binding HxlR family transcriptional regulator